MVLVYCYLSDYIALIVMLGIKHGVNLEVKLGVWSNTGSNTSVLAFLKCMDGSVLAFLKCMDGSLMVFLKCMNGSVLAHLRIPMQSAPTRFPQSGNSKVPQILCVRSVRDFERILDFFELAFNNMF